ncbi:uncharacterized protein LOC128146532 [Harpia harpyja]|uniref:uncharacterized protein LOC128146532 n=1 Tax=Harpia harpyja TaxID=202280 RepID=UPI0022B15D10|nr:uncharacterized protein LOC128146532 [Harpia harpyja]
MRHGQLCCWEHLTVTPGIEGLRPPKSSALSCPTALDGGSLSPLGPMGTFPKGLTSNVPWFEPRLGAGMPGTAAAQPQQVNGVLGGSVLLSLALSPNKTVKEIEWSFSVGAGATIQVAEFGPGGFKHPGPKDQFKDRLEMFNKTALKIGALEQGDSGVYGAWIKLHPAVVENQSFNLSVYGEQLQSRPVPVPGIRHRLLSLTTQGCNVTLRCWVPAGSDAEAVWQLGSSPRTPWGQLCEDSQTLCLAVPASTFNSSYTCVARNPIQEKNTSIRLDALCQQAGTPDWWRWHMCLGPLAMGVGALLSVVWLQRKKRRKKAAEGAALASPSSEDALLEPFYAETQRRTPPETHEWVRLGGRGQIWLLASCTVMLGPNSAHAGARLQLSALPSRLRVPPCPRSPLSWGLQPPSSSPIPLEAAPGSWGRRGGAAR